MSLRLAVTLVGVWGALAGVLVTRPVAACSCPSSALLSPGPDASNVPLNAVILFQSSPTTPVLYDVSHGVEVPATIEPFGELPLATLVRPDQLLSPNTTFEIRLFSFPGASAPRFTTGNATDDAAPTYDGFRSFRAETTDARSTPCRSSCWSGNTFERLRFVYAAPSDDTAFLLMQLYRPANPSDVAARALFRQYSQAPWPERIETGGCNFGMPHFTTEEELCIRLTAFDMAGHRSENPGEICTRAAACAPNFSTPVCTPVDECSPVAADAGPGDGGPYDAMSEDATPDVEPADVVPLADVGADAATPVQPTLDRPDCSCIFARKAAASNSSLAQLFAMAMAGIAARRRRHRT